jgi:hypothetical protein
MFQKTLVYSMWASLYKSLHSGFNGNCRSDKTQSIVAQNIELYDIMKSGANSILTDAKIIGRRNYLKPILPRFEINSTNNSFFDLGGNSATYQQYYNGNHHHIKVMYL